ncbi:MAG: FtsB family cell division protein [Saprospiraceae bacterium]|jgi:cell division protein FtsB
MIQVFDSIKRLWKGIPRFVKNKYFITTLCFAVWMLFFDKHDVFTQWKLSNTVSELKDKKLDYLKKIEETKLQKDFLENNLEKVARERYFLKKSNEEVFIIVRKEKK